MNLLFIYFQRKVVWCKEEQHHIIRFLNDDNDISNDLVWNVSECDNFQKAKNKNLQVNYYKSY